MMHRKSSRIGLLLGIAAGWVSCLQPHAIRMVDTDPAAWNAAQSVTVSYDNTDTVSARDLWAVVRFCNDYEYDKFQLSITTVTPDGYRWRDTLSMEVYGRLPHVGLYGELEQPYRHRVVLQQTGRYLFELAPVMPDTVTRGVAAVGIRLADAQTESTPDRQPEDSMKSVVSADSSLLTR